MAVSGTDVINKLKIDADVIKNRIIFIVITPGLSGQPLFWAETSW
jgi:hypothetical protein